MSTTAYYIAGTHWDREWYEPFQEYRLWLVQNLDLMLDHLPVADDFAVMHLDGQGVMLEDYLEIRPERRDELAALLQAGRLVAGPWYAMPDLFLVSGEALIRNLNLGMRTVRSLGARTARVGYCPDLFGHIAAMPMLFTGLGMSGAVVWRGLNDEQVRAQFLWVGPDGSGLPTHKLPDDIGYGWVGGKLRWPWHNADFDAALLHDRAPAILAAEAARGDLPLLYLSDGGDHQQLPQPAPRMLATLREACPDITFIHGTMEAFFDALAPHRDALAPFQGELRTPARRTGNLYHALIPHCLASRYPLKQRNDGCQNLLTLWAEPLAALALASGRAVPPGFLTTAWKWLLKNQPHDSICGCSIDETHADMAFRFHQAERLGDGIRRQSFAVLSAPMDLRAKAEHIVVWNPLPWPRHEVVELEVLFPADYPAKAMRSGHNVPLLNQFELVGADGAAIPYQVLSVDTGCTRKTTSPEGRHYKAGTNLDVYRVALKVDLPGSGYTSLSIRPREGVGTVHRELGSQLSASTTAANEHLQVQVSTAGSVTLTDRATGRVYRDLFVYEDGGDAGDGWNYVPPVHNRVVVSAGASVTVSVEEDGPLQTTLRIDRTLRVPEGLDPSQGERRSARLVDLPITDYLTLRAGDPQLHVRTELDNTAGDHRLRVLFPTDLAADRYWSDQPFAWVERLVATDPGSADYKEPDPPERPHHSVFAIAGAATAESGAGGPVTGLAVLCPEGLHEHAVIDDARRTLALTLFRAVGRTVSTDGEPGAQTYGPLSFRYALLPFAGDVPQGQLSRQVQALQAGVQTHLSAAAQGARSLLGIDASEAIALSALKPGDDGASVVLRLWNTAATAETVRVRPAFPFHQAWLCDLTETRSQQLEASADGVAFAVPAYGLATLQLTMTTPGETP